MKKVNEFITTRDGNCKSPWQEADHQMAATQSAIGAKIYDCIIVGGGITGLTAGLLLQQAGSNTLIADAHIVGFGTTGGTSAHINTFADTTYKQAESAFGEEGAQLFANAIREGFDLIKDNIDALAINCDYETKTGFLYAETDDEVKQLADIYKGCLKVGVNVQYSKNVPAKASYKQALQFENQAQFHPLKYLKSLEDAYLGSGGVIFENTLVESITTDHGVHTICPANISANNIIYATHLPPNINVFNFRCAPYRSYVLGLKLKSGKYPDVLIYDMQEPYHYIRSHTINGEQLLILGGNDHKTGHGDPSRSFSELENYARKYYEISSVKYRWSSQYYVPVDGLPYTGQMPFAEKGIYCATGFNGNGMMLGSISAKILADLVLGNENKYANLFDPSRIKPVDGFTEFVKENADVVYHFLADRIAIHETDSVKRIHPGSGKVIEINGEKLAIYRAVDETIHTLSPVCTHTGCIVNWNDAEKTWDCPCHGARYDIEGKVLTGPATHPLSSIKA